MKRVGSMKRSHERTGGTMLAALIAVAALIATINPVGARADLRVESFDARVETSEGSLDTRAGAHPYAAKVNFRINRSEDGLNPSESPKDIVVSLPAGFVGNPEAVPHCTRPEFLNLLNPAIGKGCLPEAQVGTIETVELTTGVEKAVPHPIFSLEPEDDEIADFAFTVAGVPVHLVPRIRSDGDYGIDVELNDGSSGIALLGADATFWGYPMDPVHTAQRSCSGGDEPVGCASLAPRKPFLTNPSVCGQTFDTRISMDSWQDPGDFKSAVSTTPVGVSGCAGLSFAPTFAADPGSGRADAPAGFGFDLVVPESENPNGFATPPLKRVTVAFPRGVAISPPSADGLQGCSDAALALGSLAASTCPTASKIGSLSLVTPVLPDPLSGDVILRDPRPGELFRLALIVRGPGFLIKLPGRVTPDAVSGQLTATFDDNPQLPFSSLHMELKSGPRAPLVTPKACGTYATQAELTSWARPGEPVLSHSTFTIDAGCGGSRFSPGFDAGTVNPLAGAHSPFDLRVQRADGEQDISRIDVRLPNGLLAKLGGVPLCADAPALTGACPAGSQIGKTTVGVGAGTNPLYVPQAGKEPTAVYLAGPYKGSPYSLVVKVPAQAGPFDLGTVAVRSAIDVDPVTTQVSVESDPLPRILEGVPISYRDIRVDIDRDDFMLNPTSCRQAAVSGTIVSTSGQSASVSDRFQVANCERLGFKPKLALKLSGNDPPQRLPEAESGADRPQGRRQHRPRSGDPAEDRDPRTGPHPHDLHPGAVRGQGLPARHRSTATPRPGARCSTSRCRARSTCASSHKLPDLVASLDGQIQIELAGRIDSVNARIRNTFEAVPDAPVSKFVLKMQGGRKGLLVNNTEICKAKPRAAVKFDAQNGKTSDSNPVVKVDCGKGKKK